MPRLQFYRGKERLMEPRLRPGRITIGRGDSCDIALPGPAISRLHCTIRGGASGWRVEDHSRHGTFVDDQRITDRAPLKDGSRIMVGEYTIVVSLQTEASAPTDLHATDRSHEQVVADVGDALRVERARITVTDGPGAGQSFLLRKALTTVGAEGSDVVLPDSHLVSAHLAFRVSRGRVMVEPGAGLSMLDGDRVRSITPLYEDDEVILGQTSLRADRATSDEPVIATHFGELVAHSASMKRMFGKLRRIAGHHFTVLVIGESGTGKELIARGIHEHSPRATGPFVPLNCGAIRPELFESALFGHEKGAFTGADETRDGAFQQADGGTLFLDEVGELPPESQSALLRALETGEVRRVGGSRVTFPDVRIVAATNRNLADEAHSRNFRSDLYFRLAVLGVDVPPLRERKIDVPVLAKHLLGKLGSRAQLTDEAMERLRDHPWPGNVRELRNVLIRAMVEADGRIDAHHLSFSSLPNAPRTRSSVGHDEEEKATLTRALERHGGNRTAMARDLGLARSTLHYRLKKYDLM